jgi:hypothetical protein
MASVLPSCPSWRWFNDDYEESYYAMIGSYLDESFDRGTSGMFVVEGIMGRGVPIFELERRWEALRKRPDIDSQYFKASECQSGSGEFAKFVVDSNNITEAEREKLDSISHEFLRLITHPVPFDCNQYLAVGGVGIIQQDFYDIIKDPAARSILGDSPYRLAYDSAMIQCAWAMKELNTGDTVSFVCDEHQKYSPLASEAYFYLKENNPNAAKYMASFSFANDNGCEPLQAADASVYEIRRALNLSVGQWKGELRKQFDALADTSTMFLITLTTKEQPAYIVSTHKPGEPFKLDEVMEMQRSENISLKI